VRLASARKHSSDADLATTIRMLAGPPMSNAKPTTSPTPAERAIWFVLLAAATVAAVTFVVIAAQRIAYPFELEWMEGALVDHAARTAQGLPIYCQPTPEHVPFLYAPLLFWLGGGLMAVGVDGLLALRLIAALCSIGIAMLVGHWVRKETGRATLGLVATGLFLAGYGWVQWWLDLARNDSPFLLAMLSCAYVLRHGGTRRWIPAAALATVAILAKQSAVMWLPAIGVGALILDWRIGLRFGIAGVAGIVLALGAMHLASDGWSTFYLFEMPSHHGTVGENILGFWTRDLWPIYPLLLLGLIGFVLGCRQGRAREALFLAAMGSGGLVTSWLSRMHVGGFDNVFLYGFAAACILGPIAAAGRGLALPALLAVQFGLLFWIEFRPSRLAIALPTEAHRRAHEELASFVTAQPRDVFVPGHGLITARAGKAPCAHGQAIFDLMQVLPRLPSGATDLGILADEKRLAELPPRTREALVSFRDGMLQAMRTKRFSAIVLDAQIGPAYEVLFAYGIAGDDMQRDTDDDFYRRSEQDVITQPRMLRPPIGFAVDSPYALLAR